MDRLAIKTHYVMLLQQLRDWKALDNFSAQEDVEYAKQRIAEIEQEIAQLKASEGY